MSSSPPALRSGAYRWDPDHRWIEQHLGGPASNKKIVGRMSGQDGSWWYQIAAKPYDKPAVVGFKAATEAFAGAVFELQAACNSKSPVA